MTEDYDALLKFRYRHNLSRKQMAAILGMSVQIYQAIETGRIRLKAKLRARVDRLSVAAPEKVERVLSRVGKGRFAMRMTMLELLAWRWRLGLTHEAAAAVLKIPAKEYRRLEATGYLRPPEEIRRAIHRDTMSFPPMVPYRHYPERVPLKILNRLLA